MNFLNPIVPSGTEKPKVANPAADKPNDSTQ